MDTVILKKPNLIQAWLMAVRIRTLSIPTIQVITALSLAYSINGTIDWMLALLTLLIGICVTIEVNLFNDVYDFQKGGDPLNRHGQLKVIPAGYLTERQVFGGAIFFASLILLLGIPLILKAGWIMGVILLASALMGYCYTGGPFPICYLGLSQLFIFLFYGFICILSTFYLQIGYLNASSLLLAIQMGCFAILPNIINNFRDKEEDALLNKKTTVVRFGKTFGRCEITLVTFLPFLLGFLWSIAGYPVAAVLPLVLFPLAYLLVYLVWKTNPGPIYKRFFVLCVLLHFSFGILLSSGFF